jgi:ABC-2 type transport system permease protein
MNIHGIKAIFNFEMRRFFKTVVQSLLAPVISTTLYFIVFGSAIGSRMQHVDGADYGAFIVPGLTMLSVLGQSVSNASFGIYMPRFVGTIYEILSAPISSVEIVIGYVGAAAAKSMIIGIVILITARFFVSYSILHPVWALSFLCLTSVAFCLLGFIIGIWADGFDRLQIIPLMVITPLTFLGGSFYSISMLPPFWQTVSYFNPVLYLVNGFRWSFYGNADVRVEVSLGLTFVFMLACLSIITVIFKTGYRIKN